MDNKMILHITNWIGCYTASYLLGGLWGKLFGFLFKDFLSDEGYATEHPKKYLLGVIGIMLLALLSGLLLISKPIGWVMSKIDNKIEEHFEDEEEWD